MHAGVKKIAATSTGYLPTTIDIKPKKHFPNSWRIILLRRKIGVANIFVLHGALDLPGVKGPFEAELLPDQLPGGFCYYAAGHLHEQVYDQL